MRHRLTRPDAAEVAPTPGTAEAVVQDSILTVSSCRDQAFKFARVLLVDPVSNLSER